MFLNKWVGSVVMLQAQLQTLCSGTVVDDPAVCGGDVPNFYMVSQAGPFSLKFSRP